MDETVGSVCKRVKKLTAIDSDQNGSVDAVNNKWRLSVWTLDRGDVPGFGVNLKPAAGVLTNFVPARTNKVHQQKSPRCEVCFSSFL